MKSVKSIKNCELFYQICTTIKQNLVRNVSVDVTSTTTSQHITKLATMQQQQVQDPKQVQQSIEWSNALPFESIPGPKPLPIIGNTWRFFPIIGDYCDKNILQLYQQLQKEYGNLVMLKGIAGRPPMVITFSPEDVKTVFKNEGELPYRDGIGTLWYYQKVLRKDLFKNESSLAILQGEEWRRMRSLVNTALMQPRVVNSYTDSLSLVVKDFINRIDYLLEKDPNSELPKDFLNEIYRWALETGFLISFDTRTGILNLDADYNSEEQKIINSVIEMFDLIYELNILPSMWQYFSTPKFKQFVRTMDYLTNVCRKYADEAERRIFLKNQNKDNINGGAISVLEKLLSIDKMIAVIMAVDVILGGVDTTSKTAASIMYFLAANQDKQDILRKELIEKIPEVNVPVARQKLDEMPYLRACIKEAQRIAPIACGLNRVLPNNVVLSGYKVPKGTFISTGNILMCNSEKNYIQADKYIPERWLRNLIDSDMSAKKTHPYVFLPFGHGRRACIGRRFAFAELEILIATLFRNYKFEWTHGDIKFNSRLLYGIESPLQFKLTKIR